MSDVFQPRYREEFIGIEVARRVSGAEQFIDRTRKAAQVILGEGITNVTVNLDTEDGLEAVPAGLPYCNVLDADSLKLTLFERRDLPESHHEGKYIRMKHLLRRGTNKTKPRRRDIPPRPPISPLTRDLEAIQLQNDFPVEEVDVTFSEVVPRFSADVRNGPLYLALVPDVGTRAGRMLVEQAVFTHQRVYQSSRQVGFGTADNTPSVVFASLRHVPFEKDEALANLMNKIRGWLPFDATLQKPEINT